MAHVAVEVMPWVDLAWTVGLARLVACRVHGKEGELNTKLVAWSLLNFVAWVMTYMFDRTWAALHLDASVPMDAMMDHLWDSRWLAVRCAWK